jgi:hypothetical protein
MNAARTFLAPTKRSNAAVAAGTGQSARSGWAFSIFVFFLL